MQTITKNFLNDNRISMQKTRLSIAEAWKKIAPFWPLKNLIACNPLQGFEDLPFEQAMTIGQSHFQQASLPTNMEQINKETIKWCQAFFDEGQATIHMPFRNEGFYQAWRQLVKYDDRLHRSNAENRHWLRNLPLSSEYVIIDCLTKLNIPKDDITLFLTLLLTTLPGWASYIKYKSEYNNTLDTMDYLAIRLVITYLLWPEAINLIFIHRNKQDVTSSKQMEKILAAEQSYHHALIDALSQPYIQSETIPEAQFVFCIDVRSEPMRTAIEKQGNYETFGFAGFFGIPTQIKNNLTQECYSSCPVLLKPKHTVNEIVSSPKQIKQKLITDKTKQLYQALKYTFTTPFVLAEFLGPISGLWMALRTFLPNISNLLKNNIHAHQIDLTIEADGSGINFSDQCTYAENALRMMGFTDRFSPLVVLCGHGSETQNNAYASSLDCGACGGHSGAANARILAAMLNNREVRDHLAKKNIHIPQSTIFIAALHNTTTDEITLYLKQSDMERQDIKKLSQALEQARMLNNAWRCQKLGTSVAHIKQRSQDWAQTRPEWGLARNAAFIIGPRSLTKNINLDGRSFLHSYDWQQDDGTWLETILTAPMIVAQWINSQYLFSTLDNVAYGSGSKITHNITGKIGIMQGNASDLMHGLPLQSIYKDDKQAFHEPVRLMTVIYAPRSRVDDIISRRSMLQKLFGNGWVLLACIDPEDKRIYQLQRDFTWIEVASSIQSVTTQTMFRHH